MADLSDGSYMFKHNLEDTVRIKVSITMLTDLRRLLKIMARSTARNMKQLLSELFVVHKAFGKRETFQILMDKFDNERCTWVHKRNKT